MILSHKIFIFRRDPDLRLNCSYTVLLYMAIKNINTSITDCKR